MNIHDIFDALEDLAAAVMIFVPATWLSAFVLMHFVSSWDHVLGWILVRWLPALVATALAALVLLLGRLRGRRRL
jgi:hypothetical protein